MRINRLIVGGLLLLSAALPRMAGAFAEWGTTINKNRLGIYVDTTYPPTDPTNSIYSASMASATVVGRNLFRENNMSWFYLEPLQGNFTLTQIRQRVAIATGSASGQYGGYYIWEIPASPTWDAPVAGVNYPFGFYGQYTVPANRVITGTNSYTYNLTTTVVSAICSDHLLVKPQNEPDFWNFSGDSTAPVTSLYIGYASTGMKAVRDACPQAATVLGNIAYPSTSPWAGAGNGYMRRHFFADVWADATIRSLTDYISEDIYPDSQSHEVANSTMTGMMQGAGGGTTRPNIIMETSVTGGDSIGATNEYEKALFHSSNTARDFGTYSAVTSSVAAVFVHTLKQTGTDGFGLLDANGTALTAYGTLTRWYTNHDGASWVKALDSGSMKGELFRVQNGRYVADYWTDTGSATIGRIPTVFFPLRAVDTAYDGIANYVYARNWATYTATREPVTLVVKPYSGGGVF